MTVKLLKQAVGFTAGALGTGAAALLRPVLPSLPAIDAVPEGRVVELPGRGNTFVLDVLGPTPDAPTVILLHGLAAPAALCWAPTLTPLSKMARVIAFDQRWHGRGIDSPYFTIEDCADDVAAVMDALEIPTAIMVGYSLGGAIAQMVWWRRPERVAGLVLCSTARNSQGGGGERFFFPVMDLVSRALRTRAVERITEKRAGLTDPAPFDAGDISAWGKAELATMSPWAVPLAMNAFGHFNSAPWISRVDVPTAVVVTEKDKAIPTRRQLKLAESIPGATVFRAPGGHTSLTFDVANWLPVFLEAVSDVADRSGRPLNALRRAGKGTA